MGHGGDEVSSGSATAPLSQVVDDLALRGDQLGAFWTPTENQSAQLQDTGGVLLVGHPAGGGIHRATPHHIHLTSRARTRASRRFWRVSSVTRTLLT